MPSAAFKDLVLDTADPARVAAFWGAALGLDVEARDGGGAVLRRDGTAVLWVDRVPEPKAVKNRVHPDLWVADDAALLDLGATPLFDDGDHRVLADPEGHEFCAFTPPPGHRAGPPAELFALCVDSARPEETAAWWAALVGGELGPGPDGTPRWISRAAGLDAVTSKFVRVPDARAAKNRLHWDVLGDVDELVAAGATVLRARDDAIGWTVLADPDGNEFCAFAP